MAGWLVLLFSRRRVREAAVKGWVAAGGLRGWGIDPGRRLWGAGDMGVMVRNTVTKSPGDAVRVFMDFGDLPEVEAGARVTSCTVAVSPAGPTVVFSATVNAAGYLASTKVTGGADGSDYLVTWTATLDDADQTTIERVATLEVRR